MRRKFARFVFVWYWHIGHSLLSPLLRSHEKTQFLKNGFDIVTKTLQALQMMSSVTLHRQVTKIVMTSGFQMCEM